MQSGGCLCGAVSFTVSGPMRPVVACHCKQCRKTSGHHVAATGAPRNTIAITGEPAWYALSDTARRGFCGMCGSNLFWDGGGAHLSVFAGALDGDTGREIAGHIFCADKGDYYKIADGLPQAPSDDPKLTEMVL